MHNWFYIAHIESCNMFKHIFDEVISVTFRTVLATPARNTAAGVSVCIVVQVTDPVVLTRTGIAGIGI